MATNYEVHTLKSGVWQIDSTYPQREAAMDCAKQLYGEKRFDAIKVIKDDFDPKTNQGKEIVIYDTAKAASPDKPPPPTKPEAKSAPAKKTDVDYKPGAPAKAAPKSQTSLVKPILWLVLLLIGGLGLLYGLAELGGFLGRR
jgi:hypothetical protein